MTRCRFVLDDEGCLVCIPPPGEIRRLKARTTPQPEERDVPRRRRLSGRGPPPPRGAGGEATPAESSALGRRRDRAGALVVDLCRRFTFSPGEVMQ